MIHAVFGPIIANKASNTDRDASDALYKGEEEGDVVDMCGIFGTG